MDIKAKKITVMGLARTGVACARFLAKCGARVTATDMRDEESLRQVKEELDRYGILWTIGSHMEADFTEADLVVVSPGVPQEQIGRAHV